MVSWHLRSRLRRAETRWATTVVNMLLCTPRASSQVDAMVRAPELVELVTTRLRQDPRVKYVY